MGKLDRDIGGLIPCWNQMSEFDKLVFIGSVYNDMSDQWSTNPEAAGGDIAAKELALQPNMGQHEIMFSVDRMMWTALWCEYGFPTIDIDDRQSASYMATQLSEDFADSIVPPWPSFMIRLGTPLEVYPQNEPDRTVKVKMLRVRTLNGGAGTLESPTSWRDGWVISMEPDSADHDGAILGLKDTRTLCQEDLSPNGVMLDDDNLVAEGTFPDDQNRRLWLVVRRLVAATCVRLSSKQERRSAFAGKSKRLVKKASRGGLPRPEKLVYRRFAIRNSVKVDVREAVRGYIQHGGRSPKVRTLVRGHWRNQVCGKGRLDRKWIQIEPHWRGPEDGALSARIKK